MININAYNYHFSIGSNCRAANSLRELNMKFKNVYCQFTNYGECEVNSIDWDQRLIIKHIKSLLN